MIAYFLVKMGHIVFFNTTKYDEDNLRKYDRTGFFMLPNHLTEKQKECLENVTPKELITKYFQLQNKVAEKSERSL